MQLSFETRDQLLALNLCKNKNKLCNPKLQKQKVNISIQKGSIGNRKELDQTKTQSNRAMIKSYSSVSGIWEHTVKMWVPKGLSNSIPVALLVVLNMDFLLDWLCSCPVAFLGRYFIFMLSTFSWALHCIFSFIFTSLWTAFPVVPCLAFQVFLWNLGRRFPYSTILTFCMP